MSKRALTPAPLPSAKRLHTSGHPVYRPNQLLNFENSLYDELILCIFSHLSWIDLCVTQATSKNWARLAADNELWRIQYLNHYGRTRLRGAKGFIGRLDGREVRPLPGRAKADQYKDWKWMFRISSNWRKGRCVVESSLDPSTPHSNLTERATPPFPSEAERTLIILAGSLIISATSRTTNLPAITITNDQNQHHTVQIPYQDDTDFTGISALALDQSPPTSGHLSLACFLRNGGISVLEFNHSSPSNAIQKYTYLPSRGSTRLQNVIHAVYYHPLLATLSNTFSLSIYDLSSSTIRHTQTLSSFTSYPPASLILSCLSPMNFKLVIAYSVPVYPRHWSIGATELILSGSSEPHVGTSSNAAGFSSASFREDYKYPLSSMISVISSRTIRAFDVPSGWVDESSLRAMREQWGRKLSSVADAQTDGKWVIIAPGESQSYEHDNAHSSISPSSGSESSSPSPVSASLHSPTNLQLYRLILPSQSTSISASPPKLNFVRTLHGQTGPVSSLALADGRCVSLGLNGSIWVWDLEGGTGAEVAPADQSLGNQTSQAMVGTVSFDERRIVTAHAGSVVVRRFDI
ncbi:hypothetical protein BDN70DRAFT_996985 [Pholiota conissans]|uniref:F-box domain-containing protein n=1 Tax=Pholiota conissans TaxID=109636 RepID=A0A9P5YSZ6_9AGAR|nr:hypothetical protein BDN70DRAFT_996985 [Pholiota conissans]